MLYPFSHLAKYIALYQATMNMPDTGQLDQHLNRLLQYRCMVCWKYKNLFFYITRSAINRITTIVVVQIFLSYIFCKPRRNFAQFDFHYSIPLLISPISSLNYSSKSKIDFTISSVGRYSFLIISFF